MTASSIPDRGVDLDPRNRPGVPMETRPEPVGAAHWGEPERQRPTAIVTRRVELDELPPVFGTAQPPAGISGVFRRLAYRVPELRARRWLLLLLADRIDAVEHGAWAGRALAIVIGVGVLGGYGMLRGAARRGSWRRRRRR